MKFCFLFSWFNMLKYLIHTFRNYPLKLGIINVISHHGVSFTCSSLPISKNSSIKPLNYIIHYWNSQIFDNFLLTSLRVEYSIKSKTLWKTIFNNVYWIWKRKLYFTIRLLSNLKFDIIKRSESNYNLSVSSAFAWFRLSSTLTISFLKLIII